MNKFDLLQKRLNVIAKEAIEKLPEYDLAEAVKEMQKEKADFFRNEMEVGERFKFTANDEYDGKVRTHEAVLVDKNEKGITVNYKSFYGVLPMWLEWDEIGKEFLRVIPYK